jgi:hypothetical protein
MPKWISSRVTHWSHMRRGKRGRGGGGGERWWHSRVVQAVTGVSSVPGGGISPVMVAVPMVEVRIRVAWGRRWRRPPLTIEAFGGDGRPTESGEVVGQRGDGEPPQPWEAVWWWAGSERWRPGHTQKLERRERRLPPWHRSGKEGDYRSFTR